MDDKPLKTLKEVADHFNRPAHRIIHLCEAGVVRPHVEAAGRGTVRRFSRDDTFRLLLALQLQEAGVEVPLLKPLMEAFNRLMVMPEVRKIRVNRCLDDLVALIRHLGSDEQPMLAFLTPPDRIAFVTPSLSVPFRPDMGVDLHLSGRHLLHRSVSIVANLTVTANYVVGAL